jgi:dTDP-glucose 4,6-dehydratase
MEKVLVTGGAGFIGSNFIRYLLENDPRVQVTNLDALTYAGSLENLKDLTGDDRYRFIHGDICDAELVDNIFAGDLIDTVVHFAAETHVDRSIVGPGAFVQTNVVGTFTLLEAVRKHWAANGGFREGMRFHHVSTDEVFGSLEPDEPAFSETTPYAPNSPYSASKASSDHLVRAYHHTYGLPITITNCSNNYGPRQFPEKLIPLIILNAVTGKPLPVYGDGLQVRDWLYVEDHCEAIYQVLMNGQPGETYVVGGDNQPPNLKIIQTVCAILDERFPESPNKPHSSLIQYVKDRPGHDRRYAMDITKIQQELGWRPKKTIETGLHETINWYLSNPDWVEAVHGSSDLQSWMKQNYDQRDTDQN